MIAIEPGLIPPLLLWALMGLCGAIGILISIVTPSPGGVAESYDDREIDE